MKKSTSIITDPYIYVEKNVLSPYWCKKIINKFEDDSRKQQGRVAAGVHTDIKNSIDLNVSETGLGWEKEDVYLHNALTPLIYRYYQHLNKTINFKYFKEPTKENGIEFFYMPPLNLMDTGYQVQRTDPDSGYTWHSDFAINNIEDAQCTRLLTFIFYLNTVEEGWTQFYNGNQVSPQTGNAMLFPATWTYVHQGYPPKQPKYIITGWIHIKGTWQI